MGLGLFGGGAGAARHLAERGWDVTVTDRRSAEELATACALLAGLPIRFVLGEHREEDFTETELLVVNPAVPPHNPLVTLARSRGVPVSSEFQLCLEALPARLVLVTGTHGKSSTCNALAQLCRASGQRVHLGGNIGHSLLADLDRITGSDVCVVEVSSYQLEGLPRGPALEELRGKLRVEAVGITNVRPDHLERHGDFESYAGAKRRILELLPETGTAVLPLEAPAGGWSLDRGHRTTFSTHSQDGDGRLEDGQLWYAGEVLGALADLALPGEFQRSNALLALSLARALGIPAASLRTGLPTVRGLEHRLEDLGTIGGHRVWDNAVSTTPESTLVALESLVGPTTLICGGRAKSLPLDELARGARGRVRRVIAFGEAAELLSTAFVAESIETLRAPDVSQAVRRAFESMEPGESLLFSPACSSFDAYANFRERARHFRDSLPEVGSA